MTERDKVHGVLHDVARGSARLEPASPTELFHQENGFTRRTA
jgi:hypothetical protein